MESSKDIAVERQIYSVSNNRRTLKGLKKIADTDKASQSLLGCDAMYAHNSMDGKFKTFSL